MQKTNKNLKGKMEPDKNNEKDFAQEIDSMRKSDHATIESNKLITEETFEETDVTDITPEKIPENEHEKTSKGIKFLQQLATYIVFGAIAGLLFFLQKIQTPENKTLITWITLSGLANLLIVFASILTGSGTEILKRYSNKLKYKTGKYVNTVFMMKTGIIKEVFAKKDELTGSIRIHGKPYVTNAKLLFNYKGIPSYLHRQDNPDPINVWQEGYARELSASEMDTVMASMNSFNVLEWLKKNMSYALIAVVVIGFLAGAGALMAQKNNDMLTKGTYLAPTAPVICKMIIPEVTKNNASLTIVKGNVDSNNELPQQEIGQ